MSPQAGAASKANDARPRARDAGVPKLFNAEAA